MEKIEIIFLKWNLTDENKWLLENKMTLKEIEKWNELWITHIQKAKQSFNEHIKNYYNKDKEK